MPLSALHVRALDVRQSGTSKKDLVRDGERAHIVYYEKYGAWILVEDHRGRVLRAHQLQYVETVVFDRG